MWDLPGTGLELVSAALTGKLPTTAPPGKPGVRASHCGGFSCCGAWVLGSQASVVVLCGLSSCGSRALECRLNSCGARA